VQFSRKADYILTKVDAPAPADAAGPPVRKLDAYTLYRARPDIPGRDMCSQAMVETVTKVDTGGG
jgi:hypothetical protein